MGNQMGNLSVHRQRPTSWATPARAWFTSTPLKPPLSELVAKLNCSQTTAGSQVWIYSFSLPVGKRRKVNVNEKVEEKHKYLRLLPAFYFSRCKTLDYRTRSYACIISTHNWYPLNCLLRGIKLNLYRTCRISHLQWFTGHPTSCPELDTEDMLSSHKSWHSNQPFLTWEKMGPLKVFSLETFAQCYK